MHEGHFTADCIWFIKMIHNKYKAGFLASVLNNPCSLKAFN